jgi:predicted dienelactone hydrolase
MPPTATPIPPTPTPIPPTPTTIVQMNTKEPAGFALSEPGPYFAGNRAYTFVDESRNGREIRVTIWYPALQQTDANGNLIRRNAAADMSGAPYPLILTEPNTGDKLFSTHLASHGFVMAIVRFPDYFAYDYWDLGIIDDPRDMLFALDQIASDPPEGLDGVIDSDHVGVGGYSWGGVYALALSGVRIDPEYYLSYCQQARAMEPKLEESYLKYVCNLAEKWDEFAAYVGDEITVSDDGLWKPITDERIRAVMPMAADGAWLYGERGLAAVDRPVLMIQATEDSPYQPTEATFIFENLGTPEKSMVSFVGKSHMMVQDPEPMKRMNHFATAFFGYHLQGRTDYTKYFSEDFVAQFEDLAWEVYKK